MADDMKAIRRKRASVESVAENPLGTKSDNSEQPSLKKVKKMRKYVVRPKNKICIAKDVYKVAGDIIKLDSKMAKHFLKHDCIAHHVELDDDD